MKNKLLNKIKKDEKGSITVFVLSTMLVVVGVVFTMYFSMMNKSIGHVLKTSLLAAGLLLGAPGDIQSQTETFEVGNKTFLLNDKPFIVSEMCLMHAVGGKVFMAYQRDDLLEKRRKLLQEWADFLYGED